MATVEDLPTGKVVGQFLFVSQDNADAGTAPNAVLVTGYVRFTCSASPILYYSKKVTAVPLVHDAVFDSEGYLMPLDSTQIDGGKVVPGKLERGMELLANAPGVNPEGFTWTATFNLKEAATGRALSIPPFSFLLSAGQTVDVADIFPVGASGGVLVTRGESAYDVAVSNGYTGTQAQWLTSLLAPKSVFTIGTVTASAAGANPAVSVSGTAPNHVLNFTLPRGAVGPQGIQGPANTLSIGTVTESASGGAPSATITGASPSQVLNLVLPRGSQGIQGIQGIQGAGVPTGGTANQIIQKNASNVAVWVTPNSAMVGLNTVNNTSDANKPVSIAQKAYIDALADKTTGVPVGIFRKDVPTVLSTTHTAVPWEINDKFRGFSALAGTSTLTIARAGIYSVSIKMASNSGTGLMSVQFRVNGEVWHPATVDSQSSSIAYAKVLSSFDIPLQVGDQVAVFCKNGGQQVSAVECAWSIRYVDTL